MNLRTGPHLWNLLKVWWKQWCWCATCSDIEWEDGGGVVWKCGVKQFFWLSQRRIGQKVIPSNRCQKDRTISGLTINGIRHVLRALKCALSEDVWSVVFNREGVPVKLVIFPSCRRLGLHRLTGNTSNRLGWCQPPSQYNKRFNWHRFSARMMSLRSLWVV